MIDIRIKTIPHEAQRYPTCGDYWQNPDGSTEFRISELNNEDYEFLIAVHELIEQHLTKRAGITEKSITEFDVAFEKNRKPGNTDEPGNDPAAPYHREHLFATDIENMIAAHMGIDWEAYNTTVNNL